MAAGVSGHRGDDWEAVLDTQHDVYRFHGTAEAVRLYAPHKQIRRLKGAQAVVVFTGKGPVDYLVSTRAESYHIDAKDCAGDRWPLARLEEHQADYLDRVSALSASHIGGIALRLGIEAAPRAWFVPWLTLRGPWRRWFSNPGRARAGEGSVGLDWLARNAIPMRGGSDWLTAAIAFSRGMR